MTYILKYSLVKTEQGYLAITMEDCHKETDLVKIFRSDGIVCSVGAVSLTLLDISSEVFGGISSYDVSNLFALTINRIVLEEMENRLVEQLENVKKLKGESLNVTGKLGAY